MNHLASTLKTDITLQKRYGFYYAAAFITLVWVAILKALPSSYLELAIPLVIFTDLGIVGLVFIAGQVIFEKTEGTIYALITTPLTFSEYLWSKLISLSILAWIISMTVVVMVRGFEANILWLTTGIILTSIIALLVGFIAVAPYRSISAFLIPSQLYLLVISLPLIDYLKWFESWVFYLIPTQGSLILLKGGFNPPETWQIVYSFIYQAVCIIGLFRIAEIRFTKYIVSQKGDRW